MSRDLTVMDRSAKLYLITITATRYMKVGNWSIWMGVKGALWFYIYILQFFLQ